MSTSTPSKIASKLRDIAEAVESDERMLKLILASIDEFEDAAQVEGSTVQAALRTMFCALEEEEEEKEEEKRKKSIFVHVLKFVNQSVIAAAVSFLMAHAQSRTTLLKLEQLMMLDSRSADGWRISIERSGDAVRVTHSRQERGAGPPVCLDDWGISWRLTICISVAAVEFKSALIEVSSMTFGEKMPKAMQIEMKKAFCVGGDLNAFDADLSSASTMFHSNKLEHENYTKKSPVKNAAPKLPFLNFGAKLPAEDGQGAFITFPPISFSAAGTLVGIKRSIHEIAFLGEVDELSARIAADGTKLNKRDAHHQTPLHSACKNPTIGLPSVQALLLLGADLNAMDENNKSPLHIACENGSIRSSLALIDGGANSALRDTASDVLPQALNPPTDNTSSPQTRASAIH